MSKRAGSMATVLVALAVATVTVLAPGCSTRPGRDPRAPFYPAPPQRPRVQFLTKFLAAGDVEPESRLMDFLVGDVKSVRRLRKPTAVAVHEGVLYVADPGWDTVILINLRERRFETLGDHGNGKLRVPVAIAIDAEGQKFVADSGRRQVVQFNAENEFVQAFEDAAEMIPTGVVVDERHLFVVDRGGHQVLVFDRRSGKVVRTIGEPGQVEGEFNTPTHLSRDARGHLFVTDMANFRIQEFDAEDEFVKSYGFLGDGPGTFARPKGTAVDNQGHLYTADAAFENVQIWDTSNAQVLLAFGGPGVQAGDLYLPGGVTVSDDLNEYFAHFVHPDFNLEYVILVVSNYGPNRVAVYGFVNPKDESSYLGPSAEEETPGE